jgi:DMSO/TMAO reductase YedYZ molybdopterin-dependent catalytic subunit
VMATAGSTVPLLRSVSLFGVRSGDGPGGVPINKSAQAAGVLARASDTAYRLRIVVDGTEVASLGMEDLRALPQRTEVLPIACVEGWSASGTWGGVRVSDVLAAAGLPTDRDVGVVSLQRNGAFRRTVLPAPFAADDRTLLALDLAGAPLDLDHGFPCRIIAPNRPGVLQTKWVASLEVST